MKKKPFIGTTKTGVWFVVCFPDDGSRFQKSIGHGAQAEHIAHEIRELLILEALSPDEFYSWDAKVKDWESRIDHIRDRHRKTMAEAGEFFEEDEEMSASPSQAMPQEAQVPQSCANSHLQPSTPARPRAIGKSL